MIFQEPMTALNPVMRIGDQIAETFEAHGMLTPAERRERVARARCARSGCPIPPASLHAYPHQLSGGQRQRAMIAMALALEPALLIADEPTTALDVTTQAQILELQPRLQRRRGMGVLFITHDFGVVREIADRVVVMQKGSVRRAGPAAAGADAAAARLHRALLAAVPTLRPAGPSACRGRPIAARSTG